MTPFITINGGVENMIDAFNITQDRYDAMHHLVGNIINNRDKIEGITFEKTLGDGRVEKGIDIAQAINYIQGHSLSPTEFVLGTFFFGSAMGQLIERVRMEHERRSSNPGFSIKEAILKAAKEAGYGAEEVITDEDGQSGAIAIEIPLGKTAEEKVGE